MDLVVNMFECVALTLLILWGIGIMTSGGVK